MLTMKNKVNIDDFLILITWVKSFYLFEGKKFSYEYLLTQAETYKYTNTPFDTSVHNIDNLMIDAFRVYHKLKATESKIADILETLPIPFDKNELIRETKKYEEIFEYMMENYRYEDPEIRGIQKGFLSEKMKEYVVDENYEKAAIVRDMIKEC
jgi:hypothetical protein